MLFLAPIVVLAGAGIVYGLAREPEHKAEARISIGPLNAATQGLPGFANAATNLAAAYARVITAPGIAKDAGRAAGVSAKRARDEISASSIPDTPLLRVEVSDANPKVAVKLANGAANALIDHVLQLNRRSALRDEVLSKYRSAALKVAKLKRQVKQAGGSKTADAINARLNTAELRLNALGSIYGVSSAGEISQNLLQVVAPAAEAKSDRKTTIERFGLIGGLAGLLLGLVLAATRETAEQRRAAAKATTSPASSTTTD